MWTGGCREAHMNAGFNGIQYLFASDLERRSQTLLSIIGVMFFLSSHVARSHHLALQHAHGLEGNKWYSEKEGLKASVGIATVF